MSLRLEYFHLRGRGEVARLILAAAGVMYEDRRIPFDDWPAHKKTTPLGALPVLVVDDKLKLSQQGVIVRYLAVKTGLAGKNPTESAAIDMLFESMQEVYWKLPYADEDGPEKDMKTKKVMTETILPSLNLFEKMAESKQFLVGAKLSYADLTLVEFYHNLDGKPGFEEQKFPKLTSIVENVISMPNIKRYLQKRPKSNL